MQTKFLKFFALVILIISSFFLGKHLIINAQTGSNSVRVNCGPASLCSNVTARVYVPQGGCPSGDEDCGKNNYKQDKPIPSGSTTVTLTDIPDGVYTVILIKDGYVTTPPKIEVSLGGGTTSTATFTLSLDTSKIKSFTATPKGIESGGSSTLAWQTEGLNNCSLSNGIGTIPNNGQKVVKPTITTTYILSCFNSVGIRKTAAATVTIMGGGGGGTDPALTLSSNTVKKGESIKVIWSNIPDPTKYDVIGFFNDPNAWADWSKVNGSGYAGACTKNVTDGSVNGSCSFLIPASTEPGTYKFRYRHFDQASDSYSTVVNSINFTVTSDAGGGGGGTGTGGGGGGTGTGGGGGGTGTGGGGGTSSDPSVKIDSFTATPPIIKNGESSKLTWQTTSTFPTNVGRNYVTLNGEPVGEDGERTVEPNRTTNYTLKISRSEDSGAGASGSSCSATNLKSKDINMNAGGKPRIFAGGYNYRLSLSGIGQNRRLTVNQNFGFTTLSLFNPSSPVVSQHLNMITTGGGGPFEKTGDGQSTISALRASVDGKRLVIGWSDDPDSFIVATDGGSGWDIKAEAAEERTRPQDVAVVKRPDGKYVGFQLFGGGVDIADISDPLPMEHADFGGAGVSAVPVFHSYGVLNSIPSADSYGLSQAGNYVSYVADKYRDLVLIDASKQLNFSGSSSDLAVKKINKSILGVEAGNLIYRVAMAQAGSDPDTVYVFAETINENNLYPGDIYVAKISSGGSVINTMGKVTPPASFNGESSLSRGKPFAYTTSSGSRAFFARVGNASGNYQQAFINVTIAGSDLSVGVASGGPNMNIMETQGFEENNRVYIYATVAPKDPIMYEFDCNNNTPVSSSCTAPNCASAMRVVTVGNDGGGGTGTGGEDDGTGRRSWFWWLKYYLNL